MSRHTRRRNAAMARGPKGIAQARIIDPDTIGTVLTKEDEDVALQMDDVLDLEAMTKEKGGTPSFKTRQADPMRAFSKPGIPLPPSATIGDLNKMGFASTKASPWQVGADGRVRIQVSDSTKARLDKIRLGDETDEEVINRIMRPDRTPAYPPGTPENVLSLELEVLFSAVAGDFDWEEARVLRDRLLELPEPERYLLMKDSLTETFWMNPGTEEYGKRVGAMMGFINQCLSPERTVELLNELRNHSLSPKPSPLPFMPGEPADIASKKIASVLSGLRPDAQARVLSAVSRAEHHENIKAKLSKAKEALWNKKRDLSNLDEKAEILRTRLQAADEIAAMSKDPKLQKLGESGFHKLVAAYQRGDIVFPSDPLSDEKIDELMKLWGQITENPNIFVVQHDWAAAFQNATDFSDGEFRLPYTDLIFEFRISGRRTCLSMLSDEDAHLCGCIVNIETSVGWVMAASYDIAAGNWTPLRDENDLSAPILNLCRSQIRAICIALEAEVAVSEIVRAPHRLNQKRERAGKLPIYDHRIISLSNRKRYEPRTIEAGEIEEEHRKRRLHFVRGHWVRYANHRSWRKWHLRGDPDLGFVDKEYRL